MNAGQFKADYPELFAQITAEAKASAEAEANALATVAAADVEKAKTEGATAERTRVIGIISHAEAKGREALALKLAGMPTMSIDGAAEIMSATPKLEAVAGASFDAVMAKANPTVEADAPVDGEDAEARAYVERMKALDSAPAPKAS